MSIGKTSIKWRMAFLLTFTGFILGIAAVASTHMAAAEVIPNREHHIGFWDLCKDTQTFGCQDLDEYLLSVGEDPEWAQACRGLAVTSLIIGGFSILMSVYLAYMASGIHLASLGTALLNLLAVILGLISALVFTLNSIDVLEEQLEMWSYPSWSFAVYIVGLGFYFLASILHIYELCIGH